MININVKGLQELQAKLHKMPEEMKVLVSAVIENGAKTFVGLAKKEAPVRATILKGTKGTFGSNLRQGISYYPVGGVEMSRTVVSGAHYSPYVEWGTITKVSVPAELAEYAIQFKGRGIKKNGGIYPRPFFFKQIGPVKAQIERDLKANLNDIKL